MLECHGLKSLTAKLFKAKKISIVNVSSKKKVLRFKKTISKNDMPFILWKPPIGMRSSLVYFAGIDVRSHTERHQSASGSSQPLSLHWSTITYSPQQPPSIWLPDKVFADLPCFLLPSTTLPINIVYIKKLFLWRTSCLMYVSLLISISLRGSVFKTITLQN